MSGAPGLLTYKLPAAAVEQNRCGSVQWVVLLAHEADGPIQSGVLSGE